MTALHGLARNPALPAELRARLAAIPELGPEPVRRNDPPRTEFWIENGEELPIETR